ncbi:MAG: hypothetical protein HQL25_08485 [Candidatus Omnitrophica bacterium]|nr:hypothetical protein [Candidatus Omnitrophota bacterium]
MIQTLIKNDNYSGKFVAFKDFEDHSIIGEGKTPQEAENAAEKKGFKNPVITFVPVKGMVEIY